MKENQKITHKQIILIFIGFFIIAAYLFIDGMKRNKRIDNKTFYLKFEGRVKSINYDVKGFPTITIGDSSYYIGGGYYTGHQIAVGDSMIKERGSFTYKLIKRGSNE